MGGGAARGGGEVGGARSLQSEQQPTCRDTKRRGRGIKHDPPVFVCLSCLSSLAVGGEIEEKGGVGWGGCKTGLTVLGFVSSAPRGASAPLPVRLHLQWTRWQNPCNRFSGLCFTSASSLPLILGEVVKMGW